MRFSIIIPAYNAEDHIRKALKSIKQQLFTDYELIVVCDSCTDRTQEIAKEYGAITEAVNFHADGLTRNRGLELAKGDYVLFMDDDDWWLHEFVLEQLNEQLTKHPEIDILCFSFIMKGVGYMQPTGMRGMHWPACWAKCYKREKIGGARFSNITDGSADMQFYWLMFNRNLKVLDWDMPFYYYNYLRKGSISEERDLVYTKEMFERDRNQWLNI